VLNHWISDIELGRRTITSVEHSCSDSGKVFVTFDDDVEIEVSAGEAQELQRAGGATGFDLDHLLDALG
jgi:hypothetical protein